MGKPFNNFEWATNPTYTSGPDVGTPTKVAPSAGEIDNGFVRGTASVAQHVNWALGQIQEWTDYLAGLSSDSEFLGDIEGWIESHSFVFTVLETFSAGIAVTGNVNVTGNVIASSSISSSGPVSGSNGNFTNGSISNNLNVVNNVTVGETLTAEKIVVESRTVRVAIPLSGHSPLINTDYQDGGATVFGKPNTYLGAGNGGYGLHFYEGSAQNGNRGATAASLNSGNLLAGAIEFVIPRGATLTGVHVGYRQANVSGGHDMYMEVMSMQHNSVGIYDETTLGTRLVNSPGTDASWSLSTSVATDAGMTPGSGHRFVLRFMASAGSDSFDSDMIAHLEAVYTTTHVDPND